MYKNVGKKIMVLAQVCGWLLLVAGAIAWLYFLCNGYSRDDSIGWIYLLAGVVGFVFSWPLYGFGQMVDDVHTMRNGAAKPVEVPSEELPEL